MDSQTRTAFDQTHAAIAETRAEAGAALAETRAGFAETRAAFTRIDHWFELIQAQHVDTRREIQELRQGHDELRKDVTVGFSRVRAEFRQFRDWTTAQFSDVRSSIHHLTRRVDRLEQ